MIRPKGEELSLNLKQIVMDQLQQEFPLMCNCCVDNVLVWKKKIPNSAIC